MSYTSLDTRTLQKRLEELETARAQFVDNKANGRFAATRLLKWNDTEDGGELIELIDLKEEIGERAWDDGVQLIPCDSFEDYARETAIDIGAIKDDAHWPATCIDWERAARELAMDYSLTTFQRTDYYYRQ